MIGKDQMMEALLKACPMFQTDWKAFLIDFDGPTDELPLYVALGSFARHLIALLERSQTASFSEVFRVIEQLQIEGEPYVREAMVAGLLEDLQNLNLHTTTQPEQFRMFLGAESTLAWNELCNF